MEVGFRDSVGAVFAPLSKKLAVKRDLPLLGLQMPLGIQRIELLALMATLYPVGLFSQHFSFTRKLSLLQYCLHKKVQYWCLSKTSEWT